MCANGIIQWKSYQTTMKSSWTDCWCSNKPGNKIVRKSTSTSDASLISNTYSLCAKWSFRHAFWYLSRTSSNFRPPRPAANRYNTNAYYLLKKKKMSLSLQCKYEMYSTKLLFVISELNSSNYLLCNALQISIAIICSILNVFGIPISFWTHPRLSEMWEITSKNETKL